MSDYNVIIRNGTLYDGLGGSPIAGSVAIRDDTIAAVGDMGAASGAVEIDAGGLAVAPGFINMLSWASEPLIVDGRSQSDIRQGVTLEVMGEGFSFGPLSQAMKDEFTRRMADDSIQYEIEWTTLGEYLDYLEKRGISTNVASFVGHTTVRMNELGFEDRLPTPDELKRMCDLVRQAMQEGALGLATALIYPPAAYSNTDELIALAQAAAEYDGMYISHLRSEGSTFLDAFAEFLNIAKRANTRAEIYHLKAIGQANWHKLDELIRRVESERAQGVSITANMYTYPAGATGLTACLPPWVQAGGREAMIERLTDPPTRQRILTEMQLDSDEWENMRLMAGSADNILLCGFGTEALRELIGKTLAQVAAERGTSPEDTIIDLLIEDNTRIDTVYFTISEDNLRRQIGLPWVSFGSDEKSLAPEGAFLEANPHPRAYGTFARLLGRYVREERLIPLEEAIRRLTAFPAGVLKIAKRGQLAPGYFADVVVFDPDKIQDHATFENPHQYATGVDHVWVNGVQVLRDGEHTGAKPGRVVRGPGWQGDQ